MLKKVLNVRDLLALVASHVALIAAYLWGVMRLSVFVSGAFPVHGYHSEHTTIGIMEGAMSIASVDISIPAPVHVVFAVASDWSRWESWFVGTSGFKPLTTLTRGSGARFAYRASVLGIPVPVVTEICDFVENVGWRGVSRRGPRSETRWHFEAIPGGTRFSFAMEYALPLVPKSLDAALIRPAWERMLKRSAEGLRQIVETEAPAAAAATSTPPGTELLG